MTSSLKLALYSRQQPLWPTTGRHILAQFDSDSIIVYQAYRPAIARHAVEHQCFGGEFSFTRMSWIKPSFLWMMFRSGWATKQGQEYVLAVRMKLAFFEHVLEAAVTTMFDPERHPSCEEWQSALKRSDVRIQWDPDHDPNGNHVARRAIQLGLRGDTLRQYSRDSIISIEDITPLVVAQRPNAMHDVALLSTPSESVYTPVSPAALRGAAIDGWPPMPAS
jgi:hypothetical protein